MTVCVAIKVHDCIVFAADSASSLVGPLGVSNVWQHGIKVFNLHKGLPVVGMTAGMGHFGPASISNLAKDLRISLTNGDEDMSLEKLDENKYSMEEVANIARDFFASKFSEIDPPPTNPNSFDFWIGGYGSEGIRSEIWKIAIQDNDVLPLQQIAKAEDDNMVIWGGQPRAINRLIMGFDDHLLSVLSEHGLPDGEVHSITKKLRERTLTPLVDSSMPVQDAINLADFLVDVTKHYFAFLPGADIVGGDTDIATVTKYEGFKWIRRKHYYPAGLNPMETDHV